MLQTILMILLIIGWLIICANTIYMFINQIKTEKYFKKIRNLAKEEYELRIEALKKELKNKKKEVK